MDSWWIAKPGAQSNWDSRTCMCARKWSQAVSQFFSPCLFAMYVCMWEWVEQLRWLMHKLETFWTLDLNILTDSTHTHTHWPMRCMPKWLTNEVGRAMRGQRAEVSVLIHGQTLQAADSKCNKWVPNTDTHTQSHTHTIPTQAAFPSAAALYIFHSLSINSAAPSLVSSNARCLIVLFVFHSLSLLLSLFQSLHLFLFLSPCRIIFHTGKHERRQRPCVDVSRNGRLHKHALSNLGPGLRSAWYLCRVKRVTHRTAAVTFSRPPQTPAQQTLDTLKMNDEWKDFMNSTGFVCSCCVERWERARVSAASIRQRAGLRCLV